MLDKAKQESRLKDESLRKLEDSLQNFENKARGKDQLYRTQLEKIKELKGQLKMRTTLHSQSEKQVSSLSERLKEGEDVCSGLRLQVKELESKLRELEQEHRKCSTYQEKVKDLEKKLKERGKESLSSTTVALEQKVIEQLERNLREQEHRESSLLRQKDSLGGNLETTIIANISPSSCCSLETLSTLPSAQRAKFIKNHESTSPWKSGVNEENEFLRMQLVENQLETDTLRKKLDSCIEANDKLERRLRKVEEELQVATKEEKQISHLEDVGSTISQKTSN